MNQLILSSVVMLHLDLTFMNLKQNNLIKIAGSVRKSKSLLSIHLSGNSMDEETVIQVRGILSAKARKKFVLSSKEEENNGNVDEFSPT